MDVTDWYVVVVVFWSVGLSCWVYEWVCFCCCSEGVEVEDVEDFEFCHDGSGVCLGREVFEESDDFFVDDVEWLYVCFLGVGCAPDGDVADEVGVCMHVV